MNIPYIIYTKNLIQNIKLFVFYIFGRRPFTLGWHAYRTIFLKRTCQSNQFTENLPENYGKWIDERVVEYPWLISRIPIGAGVIWDAGSALNHGYLLEHSKFSSKRVYISTLSPEPYRHNLPYVSYIYEDIRKTCFRDEFFDFICCISTIEHIGMNNTLYYSDSLDYDENDTSSYICAIHEFKRTLKYGGRLFLTIPFGRYTNHDWLVVFDSAMIDNIIEEFSPSAVTELIFKYKFPGWKKSDRYDSKESSYFDMHQKSKFTQSTPIAAESVICLELVK